MSNQTDSSTIIVNGGRLDDCSIDNKVGPTDIWKIWLEAPLSRWASDNEISALFDGRVDSFISQLPVGSIVYFNNPKILYHIDVIDSTGTVLYSSGVLTGTRVLTLTIGGTPGAVYSNVSELYIETVVPNLIVSTGGLTIIAQNELVPGFHDNTPLGAAKAKFSGWIDTYNALATYGLYAYLLAQVRADVAGTLYVIQSDDAIAAKVVQMQDSMSLVSTSVVVDPTVNPPLTSTEFIAAYKVAISRRFVGIVLVNGAAPQTEMDMTLKLLGI
jgi:hypothetical protein